jgi:hypothetical protein
MCTCGEVVAIPLPGQCIPDEQEVGQQAPPRGNLQAVCRAFAACATVIGVVGCAISLADLVSTGAIPISLFSAGSVVLAFGGLGIYNQLR